MKTRMFALVVLFSLHTNAAVWASPPEQECSGKYFSKIITVVLENADYQDAIKQPFLRKLAANGTLFTNFRAETHPSQANYFAMVSGSTQHLPADDSADDEVNLNGHHIGDLLENAGLNWKSYAEQYPGDCFLESDDGLYTRRHVPLLSFRNVQKSSARCARVVNSKQFDIDVANGTLPEYSFYTPDLKNDGHEPSTVAYADRWLSKRFTKLFANSEAMKCTLFVVTFDEAEEDDDGKNRVFTLFYGPMVKPGNVVKDQLNHYSLLRLVEENWPSIGTLNAGDKNAASITGWKIGEPEPVLKTKNKKY